MSDLTKGWKRISYYVSGFSSLMIPRRVQSAVFESELRRLSPEQLRMAEERAEYYVRLPDNAARGFRGDMMISDFSFPWMEKERHSAYFFDIYPYLNAFPGSFRFNYFAGDTDLEAGRPTLIKSRPVSEGVSRSAICRLNSLRHFRFVYDPLPFGNKKDMAVMRNEVRRQPWRTRLLEMYAGHPMTDFGQINADCGDPACVRPFMPIEEQLKHKFIMCVRGHDVATNLKWVMSSNSLAVMPRVTVESWYQEGLLVPNVHYVEIRDDYSDLPERLEWFIRHPKDAEEMIRNANRWTERYRNPHVERCTMYLTLRRYFEQTGQI